ncbi:unnamed protein product [Bubo scandiacus]
MFGEEPDKGLNTVTCFWVPLKLHPSQGWLSPQIGLRPWEGHGESPETLVHTAAGPSHVVGMAVAITVAIAAAIMVGIMVASQWVGIMVNVTVGIVVGIVVGITADIAAGSTSQICKTSPARATRNRFRSAKCY